MLSWSRALLLLISPLMCAAADPVLHVHVAPPLRNASLQPMNALRRTVLDVLSERRVAAPADRPYRVIDVGGAVRGWSAGVIDAVLDRIELDDSSGGRVALFRVRDANDADEWKQLLDHVAAEGRFDFAICTHFLEVATPHGAC